MTIRKYGRTYHLPFSPGVMSDDKILRDMSVIRAAKQVIFTEKMDGENTTIHQGGCHARSPDSGYHASRDWMKAFAAAISPQLGPGERVVGEYLFARHSVAYDDLPSYFLGFALIRDRVVQDWDSMIERFSQIGVEPVRVLYRGAFTDAATQSVLSDLDLSRQEGFVVRIASAFAEDDMGCAMAKYVRAGHVQSDQHWMHAQIVRNGLR